MWPGCTAENLIHDVPASDFDRPEPFEKRRPKQIGTHAFPTTSIGSFPQTPGPSHHAPPSSHQAYMSHILNRMLTSVVGAMQRSGAPGCSSRRA